MLNRWLALQCSGAGGAGAPMARDARICGTPLTSLASPRARAARAHGHGSARICLGSVSARAYCREWGVKCCGVPFSCCSDPSRTKWTAVMQSASLD
eukprot:scaffold3920_cov134-Isochrysis_galbana.AAC.3